MSKDVNTLMCSIAKGDMNALGTLYDILSIRIFNYARTIINNKELAEDVTHDVFLQINKKAINIAKVSDPIAYIMVMTRNHSYNMIKHGNRVTPLDDAFEISDNSSPYDRLLFKEAFVGLSAKQRETVYLHLICGFSFKDTAKLQNVPLVTTKWRYSKALSHLKEYFTQEKKEENCNGTY